MDALVGFLITVCIIAAVFYLVIWVLGQIGVPLPGQVIKILWVIFALIVLLALYHMFSGSLALPKFK
jgi:hypothetical protein